MRVVRLWSRGRRTVVAAAVIAVAVAACGGGGDDDDAASTTADEETTTTTEAVETTAATEPVDPYLSYVAEAVTPTVQVYAAPRSDARKLQTLRHPTEIGAPLVFLVREQKGNWLRVLLPVRPNGSEGWIYKTGVRLTTHRYRVVISLSQFQITVTDGPDVILQEPVGLGTNDTPTPGGLYYIKELLEPPNPRGPYGPYAYGLSGFSNVLFDFAGGTGVIGLHGTNDPAGIGHQVSHGCIRMSNSGITFLAERLPLGVPVQIDA